MTILSAQTIRKLELINPLVERQQHESGCSFGLSACGYDVRLDQDITITPGCFVLASTMEQFHMPNNVVGKVHDKSTWARRGLAVQNTVIEPGWTGYLTLEISCNVSFENQFKKLWSGQFQYEDSGISYQPFVIIKAGTPIAQIVFEFLDESTEQPYPTNGKYQNQERGVVEARNGVGKG